MAQSPVVPSTKFTTDLAQGSYGVKYFFVAPGLREGEYRCELLKDGFTGTATSITRDMGSINFVAGKDDLAFQESLMPARAEITFREQSLVEEMYGGRDRLWRADIYRRPTPSDLYDLWFRGFILGDMGRFDPGSFKGPVTMEAVGGLELLKNIDRPFDGAASEHSVWTLIDDAVQATQIGLDYNVTFPWFYRLGETDDTELLSSDTKLQTLWAEEAAHQKDRDRPEGEGELRSHYDILRTILQTLNLRLVQAGGEWWIRQRHQGRYGATPTHNYTPGNSTPNSTTDRDYVHDLDASDAVVEKRPSDYHRNLGRFDVIHDFGPYLGRGLPEGGFETVGHWTLNTESADNGGGNFYDAQHVDHDNFDPSQDETQDNEHLVVVYTDWLEDPDDNFNPCVVSDPFSFPSSSRRDELLTLSFMHVCSLRTPDYIQMVRLEHGGYWLTDYTLSFPRDTTKGEDARIPCSEVKAPIPEGASFYIHGQHGRQYRFRDMTTTIRIELTEKAEVGQTHLQADLPQDLIVSDFPNDDPVIRPFTWSTTETSASIHFEFFEGQWRERVINAFMQTAKGDGQQVVEGDEMTLSFGYADRGDAQLDGTPPPYLMAFDEVQVELTVGDSEVVQAEFATSTDERQSEDTETTTYLGDGPSADSKARLFYRDEATGGGQDQLLHWATAPFSGGGEEGLRLGHLRGREYVRELRTKHRGMNLTVYLTDASQVFLPHHLILWDGQLWSIENYDHVPDDGAIDVKLMPVLDEGTANLEYVTQLTTGGSGGGGATGGGSTGSGIGTGTTANTEASAFRRGSVPQNEVLFSHLSSHSWSIQRVRFLFGSAPNADYEIDVMTLDETGNFTNTVTVMVSAGSARATFDLDLELGQGYELRVASRSSDSGVQDVRTAFDFS